MDRRWIWRGALVVGAFAAGRAVSRALTPKLDLRGKVALVTGGSRGLGLVLARQLAAEGCHVAICARDEKELDAASRDLLARGADVLAVPCDVADRDQVEEMLEKVVERFGSIDIVVNNASVIQVAPLEEMTIEDFEHAMDVNFWGTVHTTLAALPRMRERGGGNIVQITSIGGKIAVPHLLPYDAAKFAALGFSEGLRAEVARDGIVVTVIVPGLMRTGSPSNAMFKGKVGSELTWFDIGDSIPGLTLSADRAARKIIRAMQRGTPEVTLGVQFEVARVLHDLFPSTTMRALSVVNRLLPAPDGRAFARPVKGREVVSKLAPSWLTTLSNRAARKNAELASDDVTHPEHEARIRGAEGA